MSSLSHADSVIRVLNDRNLPLKQRFRALFILRNLGGHQAIDGISSCLSDPSALLKHELAFCLGQMQDPYSISILMHVLQDQLQDPMVRHEAGEALGAIGDIRALDILDEFSTDPSSEVAETCQLAARRLRWSLDFSSKNEPLSKNPYASIDPTPPMSTKSEHNMDLIGKILVDSTRNLWDRYRAMFTLRNIGTEKCIRLLAQGLFCEDSALFRHEIAYVLGQIQSPIAIEQLIERLQLNLENYMVRHECAEALGAIGTQECRDILSLYLDDQDQVLMESCQVALDMADYENGHEFQYASVND